MRLIDKETVGDAISRKQAINALWNSLYDYEDKTEKEFLASKESVSPQNPLLINDLNSCL